MERPLFQAEVLLRLNALKADATATVGFEYLSGGLVWSDELPTDEEGRRLVQRSSAFQYALAYRASLTLGAERTEFRRHWQQLEEDAPNWPGLRVERRGPDARRELELRGEI